MKIYRIIDDGTVKLTTVIELEAYKEWYRLMQKHDAIQNWGWIDTEEVS